jgi:hypothetical protein
VDGVSQAAQISERETIVSMQYPQLRIESEHRIHFRTTHKGKIKAVLVLDKLRRTL